MIVIMRDAVMPECCKTCVCSEGYGCGITGTVMTTKEMESRPDWCPLEEVEPCEEAVSRKDAIRWVKTECNPYGKPTLDFESGKKVIEHLERMPSVTPKAEQTEYIPDTKAIPSEKDCVDLSERVTATFYDDEYEEWSQKTVTIRDVLDSVCDEYTVLPSVTPKAQQRWIPCDWCAYNPPSSMDGKPCTVCPAVANPEPYREEGENQ